MHNTIEVCQIVHEAITHKKPFSLVRVGDGENIVLAQRHVIPMDEIVQTTWAKRSRTKDEKGIRLPNEDARDKLIASLKSADLVGITNYGETEIAAAEKLLRPLTDACFTAYGICPRSVCHACVNRHLVELMAFWKNLTGRKVALISKWADAFSDLVMKDYAFLNIEFTAKIPFVRYEDIDATLALMERVECDVVLVSAGVSAVILAERLASEQGRVAVDFGKAPEFMVTRSKRIRPWKQ